MSAKAGKGASRDGVAWQRLDLWLWCARVAKARSDCARLVEEGAVRLNRQPTAKAHARLRIGDVLTMALRGEVRVWRVMALAARRGAAPEARALYEELPERPDPCAEPQRAAYRGARAVRPDSADPEDHHQER